MPTALTHQTQPVAQPHPLLTPATSQVKQLRRQARTSDLDSLLRTPSVPTASPAPEPLQAESAAPMPEAFADGLALEVPAIFKGFLVAMMLNGAGLMLAMLGYEAWSLLIH